MTAVAVMDRPQVAPVRSAADGMIADFQSTVQLARVLVQSGFLPKAINTPEKAVAVMLAGREMGLGPMLALRSISIVDGKPVVAADLQLGRFKADGGRAIFSELTEERATLKLRHPNGDEHTESFSVADAQAAGLLGKDNWKKYRKAMLRSRVITAGLKSVGYEPTAGAYDPDEAAEFAPLPATAAVVPERPSAAPELAELTLEQAEATPYPWPRPEQYVGKPLRDVSTSTLRRVLAWCEQKIEGGDAGERIHAMAEAVALVLSHRPAEEAAPKEPAENPTTLAPGRVEDALRPTAEATADVAPDPAVAPLIAKLEAIGGDPAMDAADRRSIEKKIASGTLTTVAAVEAEIDRAQRLLTVPF